MNILFVLVFCLNELIKVVFPVKEQFVCVFFLSCSQNQFAITSVVKVKLGSSPLLNLRIVRTGNGLEYVFSESGDSEVCQCTEKLCELLFALVSLEV